MINAIKLMKLRRVYTQNLMIKYKTNSVVLSHPIVSLPTNDSDFIPQIVSFLPLILATISGYVGKLS